MKPGVCILIPVYNAFADARACLNSVLKNTEASPDSPFEILVIDDASPAGDFENYFKENGGAALASLPAFGVLRFRRNLLNLGFVKTCNSGMKAMGKRDIVLLNSDTLVAPGWVKKLSTAAYSSKEIGTVTPLTNNGTVCSIPNFCEENSMPLGFDVEKLDSLVERVSLKRYPKLPTCVGFCTYIKRELLNKVGYFDEENFGRGYGEENDLSCRAQKAGYVDVLDDATFVFHKGSASFAGDKAALSAKNSETLAKLHPSYFPKVHRFIRENPLSEIQDRIRREIFSLWLAASSGRAVLHILHNGPFTPRHHNLGGTELQVQDLIGSLPEFEHWSLATTRRYYVLSAHLGSLHQEFWFKKSPEILKTILDPRVFPLVHVQHLLGFDFSEMAQRLQEHGNYIVSLHDFFFVCQRINLITREGTLCSGQGCLSSCQENREALTARRETSLKLLNAAQNVIHFSDSTRNVFETILGGRLAPAWLRIPHGQSSKILTPPEKSEIPRTEAPIAGVFKVLFLGAMAEAKGLNLVLELVKHSELAPGLPVEWHLLGGIRARDKGLLIEHGEYARPEVVGRLKNIAPDLVLIPSICPETYCLTLDEAWRAGVPVLVTPNGAPPERVQKFGGGWVLASLEVNSILASLADLARNPEELKVKRQQVANIRLPSSTDSAALYAEGYTRAYANIASSQAFAKALPKLLALAVSPQKLPAFVAPLRRTLFSAYDALSKVKFLRLALRGLRSQWASKK